MSDWATPGNQATFIQWKGTQLCMDFHCPACKADSHIDESFAHYVKCLYCDSIFELQTCVKVRQLEEGEIPHITPVTDRDIPETVDFNGEEVSYKEFLERL